MSLAKNSFTIIETILSILILSLIVGAFFKILTIKNTNINSISLENLEKQNKKIHYINIYKNNNKEKIKVYIQELKNNNIKLTKYTLL